MGTCLRRIGFLAAVLSLFVFPAHVLAQTDNDERYKAERQKAVELFKQNKTLEALPLFEALAKKNPKDHQVLLGLAVGLVDEAATIEDEGASAKERIRARELLLKARELGNNSTLLQNLLQLLPEDGIVKYENSPADRAMRAAEAAFAKRDFDGAIKNYSRVLETDPKNYSAVLYIGDSYFAKGDFANSAAWYERATRVDPDKETAFRYYADQLTKNGDMEKAREMAIRAVVAEPYNPITWRGLQQWAAANHLELKRVHINPHASSAQQDGKNVTISVDPNQSTEAMAAWIAYNGERILWRNEKFAKQFPQEKQYRHSLAEEAEALGLAASVWGETSKKESSAPKDPDLALCVKLAAAKMLEPYVLLSGVDKGIAQDYAAYREKNREKLVAYLSEFVVPPAPAKK